MEIRVWVQVLTHHLSQYVTQTSPELKIPPASACITMPSRFFLHIYKLDTLFYCPIRYACLWSISKNVSLSVLNRQSGPCLSFDSMVSYKQCVTSGSWSWRRRRRRRRQRRTKGEDCWGEVPGAFYLHSVGMGKDPWATVKGLSHVVRRKTPLPVWRAILGTAQLIPGPRELPISGRGFKSFTAAAPFLLLLPSVLAKQRNRVSEEVTARQEPKNTT